LHLTLITQWLSQRSKKSSETTILLVRRWKIWRLFPQARGYHDIQIHEMPNIICFSVCRCPIARLFAFWLVLARTLRKAESIEWMLERYGAGCQSESGALLRQSHSVEMTRQVQKLNCMRKWQTGHYEYPMFVASYLWVAAGTKGQKTIDLPEWKLMNNGQEPSELKSGRSLWGGKGKRNA
jgi:hypothetical protein